MKKTFLFATMALSLLACSEQKAERTVNPIKVDTETVKASNDVFGRTYVGVIEEESATSISFSGSGTLTRVYVEEGQNVRAGQLIAELDKTQANNLLVAAEAQMRQASDALQRMQQLHDNGSLAEMKWVEIQSGVEQAKAQLDLAKKQLADCSVYAPVSGIIGNGVKETGETVLPALPVASILNINRVKVKVSVPEKEISQFKATTSTTVTVEALEGRSYKGGSITRSIEANAMTHTYDIKIMLSNTDHSLLPGMVCQVKVNDTRGDVEISVPITSVQKNAQGERFVWTVKGGQAHRTVVETGLAVGNRIVISRGLSVGDMVVTEGYQKLSEGIEVKM